jgi:hypothetical protein
MSFFMIERFGFSQASNLETDYVTHLPWPRDVYTDAELTHVPTQDCPTSKSAQIQHRQCFKRNQTGSVTSQQLDQFAIGANSFRKKRVAEADATLRSGYFHYRHFTF